MLLRRGCAMLRKIECLAKYLNPLIATLNPQSNGPSYSNIVHWYQLRIIRCGIIAFGV